MLLSLQVLSPVCSLQKPKLWIISIKWILEKTVCRFWLETKTSSVKFTHVRGACAAQNVYGIFTLQKKILLCCFQIITFLKSFLWKLFCALNAASFFKSHCAQTIFMMLFIICCYNVAAVKKTSLQFIWLCF